MKDILINNVGNGTTGRLYNRFRYLRKLDRDTKMKQNYRNSNGATTDETRTNVISHSIDDLLFLKTVVVSANTMDEIRQRLVVTRERRDEMVKHDTIDYLEHFPYKTVSIRYRNIHKVSSKKINYLYMKKKTNKHRKQEIYR